LACNLFIDWDFTDMKKIQYLDILKRAFLMTWNNKFLWVFGLFVFLGSLNSNLNFNTGKVSETNEKFQSVVNFMQSNPRTSLALGLMFLLVAIVFFLMRFLGMAAIIKSANNISVYSQSKIRAVFSEAEKYLWRLLLLEIIVNLALLVVIIILVFPISYLFALKANTLAILSGIIAVVIFVPLLLIAYFLRRYAYFYIVLGDMKIRMSLELAYSLLRKNIRESLIMGCTTIAAAVVFLAAAFIFIAASVIMIVAIGLALYFLLTKIGAVIVFVAGGITGIILLLILFSWYSSFVQTIWVLFFQEISLEKQPEKKLEEKVDSAEKIPTPEAI
jgi:hypothetical protein